LSRATPLRGGLATAVLATPVLATGGRFDQYGIRRRIDPHLRSREWSTPFESLDQPVQDEIEAELEGTDVV
jgi:hypothetical protein